MPPAFNFLLAACSAFSRERQGLLALGSLGFGGREKERDASLPPAALSRVAEMYAVLFWPAPRQNFEMAALSRVAFDLG